MTLALFSHAGHRTLDTEQSDRVKSDYRGEGGFGCLREHLSFSLGLCKDDKMIC